MIVLPTYYRMDLRLTQISFKKTKEEPKKGKSEFKARHGRTLLYSPYSLAEVEGSSVSSRPAWSINEFHDMTAIVAHYV